MKTYPTNFVVTGIKDEKVLNGGVAMRLINLSHLDVKPGDRLIGEMFLEEFPDSRDPSKMCKAFKLLVEKHQKGKGKIIESTESF